jgi:glycosyltransferase involved in cell wall biosynthesis
LRIVHVTSYQVPGFGYEEIMLAREQVRMGHSVWIVASNYLHPLGDYSVLEARFPVRQVAPRTEIVDGVTVIRQASFQIHNRVWIRGLGRLVRSLRPDVVHCHNLLQFHPARLAAARMRAGTNKFVLLVDDHTLYNTKRNGLVAEAFYTTYRHLIHAFIAHGVSTFTAAAEECQRFLVNECGVEGMPEVVPLGVDPELFRPDAVRRSAQRSRFAIPSDALVVIYTGKIVSTKKIDVLIDAIAELKASEPSCVCLAVGDAHPEYAQALAAQIDKLGLGAHFRVFGSVSQEELASLYSASDIAVWPGAESMALFEGMASGLPVVVPERSAYAEITAGGVGRTFRAGDAKSLASVLIPLTDHDLRHRLGAEGRAYIKRTRTWRSSANRYLRIYQEALGTRGDGISGAGRTTRSDGRADSRGIATHGDDSDPGN